MDFSNVGLLLLSTPATLTQSQSMNETALKFLDGVNEYQPILSLVFMILACVVFWYIIHIQLVDDINDKNRDEVNAMYGKHAWDVDWDRIDIKRAESTIKALKEADQSVGTNGLIPVNTSELSKEREQEFYSIKDRIACKDFDDEIFDKLGKDKYDEFLEPFSPLPPN